MDHPGTLTVVIMAVGTAGYFLARWRRALLDLRKTVDSIPVLRRAVWGEGGRFAFAAFVIFAVVYAWLHR